MKCKPMILAGLCCAIAVTALSRESITSIRKTFDKPHQLRDVMVELQLAGWLVTLEEVPVVSPAELELKPSPTGLPVFVKRTVPFPVDVSEKELALLDNQARAGVIRDILSGYSGLGNRDSYTIIQRGKYLHITPIAFMGKDGAVHPFEPILDTKISFPEQHFDTLYEFVQTVLNEINQKRDVSVVLGNVPSNVFRQSSVVEVANNEAAQEVLARGFAEINGPRLAEGLEPAGLPWTLSYDATDNQYWFGVNAINIEAADANKSPQAAHTFASHSSAQTPHVLRKN